MDYPILGIDTNTILLFTHEDKEFFLRDPSVIDKGIKKMVDAINSVNVFSTMNSCQGFLIETERADHCPITYVDFYVLEHQYHIANMLLISLSSKFGTLIECGLTYEADFDLNEDDEVVDNGFVQLRYRIELYELIPDLKEPTYKEIVNHIKRFAKEVNLHL